MSQNSKIEWTEATWSPVLGCERLSEGCDGCYAIRGAHRLARNPNPKISEAFDGLTERRDGRIDWTGAVRLLPDRLTLPLRWKTPKRIFVCSQADLFHKDVPTEFIARVFAVMAQASHHTFQVLTKRPGRMRSILRDLCRCGSGHAPGFHFRSAMDWAGTPHSATYVPGVVGGDVYHHRPWPLPNVHIGVSVENQKWANVRIPLLLETPAAVRWLSCEPLLGPVDLWGPVDRHGGRTNPTYWLDGRPEWAEHGEPVGDSGMTAHDLIIGPRVDWVVVGGESGPRARPMHPAWARQIRDQCAASGVAFSFKQWGEWAPVEPDVWQNRAESDWQIRHDGYAWPLVEPHGAEDGTDVTIRRYGKRHAGRELDGRIWDEYPGEFSDGGLFPTPKPVAPSYVEPDPIPHRSAALPEVSR